MVVERMVVLANTVDALAAMDCVVAPTSLEDHLSRYMKMFLCS